MNTVSVSFFRAAIHSTHGAQAELVSRERVCETHEGEAVWQGEVLIFDLEDHPTASKCYCWEVDGEVVCVLGTGPVDSALKAVQASILAEADSSAH